MASITRRQLILLTTALLSISSIQSFAFQSSDSLAFYHSKIITYYHSHNNAETYKNYIKLQAASGYSYDSTAAKMAVVSGVRALQAHNTEIDPQPLLQLLESLIEKDKRWLHFRADVYTALSKYNKDGKMAAEYANLKQADMVLYDNLYRPYDYNVLIP